MNDRPIHLIVSDDLQRSRLTVFFRLLLAIPHLIWLSLWGIAASVAVIVNWFATLIAGRSPDGSAQLPRRLHPLRDPPGAYILLAAEPFPDFLGKPGYPVDVEIAPSQPQNRWKVGFRIVLAIPGLILIAGALTSGSARTLRRELRLRPGRRGGAVFGWFVALAQARLPRGLRDAIAYALSYSAQLDAYLFLLTDRYPDSNPQTALASLPVTRRRPDSTQRQRRPRALAPDGVLSSAARHPPPDLADALGDRRLPRRDRQLVCHARKRRLASFAAPLPGGLRSLPEPRIRLPVSDRRSVPGLHRPSRQLSGRSRDRGSVARRTAGRLSSACSWRLPAVALYGAYGGLLLTWRSWAGSPRLRTHGCRSECATPGPLPCAMPLKPAATCCCSPTPIPIAGRLSALLAAPPAPSARVQPLSEPSL